MANYQDEIRNLAAGTIRAKAIHEEIAAQPEHILSRAISHLSRRAPNQDDTAAVILLARIWRTFPDEPSEDDPFQHDAGDVDYAPSFDAYDDAGVRREDFC